jgi:hypothetical protein
MAQAGRRMTAEEEYALRQRERQAQCNLLRDLFRPYHSLEVGLGRLPWNTGVVPKLAQAIYDEHAFDRLPILADALEEAGCDDAEVLAHCRGGGEHARGCWVVDWLLGRG